MIKANELRIGDLVSYRGEKIRVTMIAQFGIQSKDEKQIINAKFINPSLNAIPLTEEILLKCGFDRHDEGSVSAQFSIGINPVTNDYMLYLVWIKSSKDYSLEGFPFFKNGHHTIKYLHQLQNLYFALTGEELDISNLFPDI